MGIAKPTYAFSSKDISMAMRDPDVIVEIPLNWLDNAPTSFPPGSTKIKCGLVNLLLDFGGSYAADAGLRSWKLVCSSSSDPCGERKSAIFAML